MSVRVPISERAAPGRASDVVLVPAVPSQRDSAPLPATPQHSTQQHSSPAGELSLPAPTVDTAVSLRTQLRQQLVLADARPAGALEHHAQIAGGYLERMRREHPGTAETISCLAEFHAFSASRAMTPQEQQSSWQSALQALDALRRSHPADPLTGETLALLASYAFRQASRGNDGTGA